MAWPQTDPRRGPRSLEVSPGRASGGARPAPPLWPSGPSAPRKASGADRGSFFAWSNDDDEEAALAAAASRGDCRGDCCVRPADVPMQVMSFAGEGSGEWVQETRWAYVGRGAGEFALVADEPDLGSRRAEDEQAEQRYQSWLNLRWLPGAPRQDAPAKGESLDRPLWLGIGLLVLIGCLVWVGAIQWLLSTETSPIASLHDADAASHGAAAPPSAMRAAVRAAQPSRGAGAPSAPSPPRPLHAAADKDMDAHAVQISMVAPSIEYKRLRAHKELERNFITVVQQAVALTAGHGVQPEDAGVRVSSGETAGPTLLRVTLLPPPDVPGVAVWYGLLAQRSEVLRAAIQDGLVMLPDIREVLIGETPWIDNLQVSARGVSEGHEKAEAEAATRKALATTLGLAAPAAPADRQAEAAAATRWG